MKDAHGNTIRKGQYLLCIDENHLGETTQVESENGELCLPDCNGITCSVSLSSMSTDGKLDNFIICRNPYKINNYRENAELYKDLDMTGLGEEYIVDRENCTNEQLAILYGLHAADEREYDENRIITDAFGLAEAKIYDAEPLGYGSISFEEEATDFINCAEHYLVFMSGYGWRNADCYKIVDSINSVFSRNYDCSIYPRTASARGKWLECSEHSHDNPMGCSMTVIALTEKEFERLEDAEFATVQTFAEKTLHRTAS